MTNHTKKRMRKKDTPPEVWIAHKKARKKVASAKWYARVQSVRVTKREEVKQKIAQQYLQEKKQREESRLDRTADQDLFECRWKHHVDKWPPRPPDISAADWVALMKLTEQSQEHIMTIPVMNKHPDRIQTFRRICMEELEQTFRKHRQLRTEYAYDDPLDEEAIETLCRMMRLSSSSSTDDSTFNMISHNKEEPATQPTSSSPPSMWMDWMGRWRQHLVGRAFPWTATWLGVVLVDVIIRGQSHRWPGLLKYMYQLSHTNPSALPTQTGQNIIIHNPSHIPQSNPT